MLALPTLDWQRRLQSTLADRTDFYLLHASLFNAGNHPKNEGRLL